ncbi:MAG: universal stress protein [Halanaeroarchaeum sp.]
MQFVVAFDGSDISRVALSRAATLAAGVDESVTALTVIPGGNPRYARDHGWIDEDESWDREIVLTPLREAVDSVTPDATFAYRTDDKYAPRGDHRLHAA